MDDRNVRVVLAGLLGVLIFLLALAGWAAFQNIARPEPTAVAVQSTTIPETAVPDAESTAAPLPPPAITLLPTSTPSPTPPATDTPPPTDTPVATDTPEPTATATRPPVIVQPTSTPVPPTVPPPPTQPPSNTRGLSANFSLEGGPSFAADEKIWFNFGIANANGAPVEYGALGVWPRKGGTDRLDLFQYSYTTNEVPPSGFQHRDNIQLSESGSYTLRLAICFTLDLGACRSGNAEWVSLSGEIPITIR